MDLPRLEAILEDFHRASGMDIAIIDSNFRVLARRHSGMDFCSRIHSSPQCLEKCIASDNVQMRRVNEEKTTIAYTCPFGIFEAITPIMKNGQVIAYLFLSMGIEQREGCYETPRNEAIAAAPQLDRGLLEKALEKVPCYEGRKLEAFAGLLPMVAEYIENNDFLSDANQSLGQMIKNYIKSNLDQKITLADLSYRLHCSTVTLTNHFKAEFGITIMEYVIEKRMNLAKHLLLENTYSIAQIAEKCGFSDPEYFSKCFKRCQGCCPQVWKKNRLRNRGDPRA